MGELICVFGIFAWFAFCFWIGWQIGNYVESRKQRKLIKAHFEAKRKEHNEKILKAFEKALESEPIKEYLIKVFSEAKQRKENESN